MGMKQEIRDRGGNLIGKIEDKGSIIDARDKHGNILGFFYPSENKTRDKHGNIVAIGNILASLIFHGRR